MAVFKYFATRPNRAEVAGVGILWYSNRKKSSTPKPAIRFQIFLDKIVPQMDCLSNSFKEFYLLKTHDRQGAELVLVV